MKPKQDGSSNHLEFVAAPHSPRALDENTDQKIVAGGSGRVNCVQMLRGLCNTIIGAMMKTGNMANR